MLLSLAEIVNKACETKDKSEKVEWLKKNDTNPLRQILAVMYDKDKYKLLVPNTKPPYTPSEFPDSRGMLYREVRKFKYFYENPEQGNVDKIRREALFIQLLESIHQEDAELIVKMIAQKPLKGLSAAIINEAFPDLITTKSKSKKDE